MIEASYPITYLDGQQTRFYPIRVTDVAGHVVPIVLAEEEALVLFRDLFNALPPVRKVVKESGVS